MRHLKSGKRLGVTTSHRRAMMRNLVTALFEHGQIKTTLTRAKEMRKDVDKMIGYAKRGDLHSRRRALAFVKSKDAMERLFDELGDLYKDRNGGYTRIFKLGNRLGDNAKMALIQLIDLDGKEEKQEKKVKEEKQSEAIEAVKADLVEETEAKSEDTTEVEAEEKAEPEEAEKKDEKAE